MKMISIRRNLAKAVLVCAVAAALVWFIYPSGNLRLSRHQLEHLSDEIKTTYHLALKGDHYAAYELGMAFYRGDGTKQDDAEAFRWIESAAKHQIADAQYMTGRMYAEGRGVGKDTKKALEYFGLASLQGHPAAAAEGKQLDTSLSHGEWKDLKWTPTLKGVGISLQAVAQSFQITNLRREEKLSYGYPTLLGMNGAQTVLINVNGPEENCHSVYITLFLNDRSDEDVERARQSLIGFVKTSVAPQAGEWVQEKLKIQSYPWDEPAGPPIRRFGDLQLRVELTPSRGTRETPSLAVLILPWSDSSGTRQ